MQKMHTHTHTHTVQTDRKICPTTTTPSLSPTHLDLIDVVDGVVELHGLTAPLGRGAGHAGRLGGVGQRQGHV